MKLNIKLCDSCAETVAKQMESRGLGVDATMPVAVAVEILSVLCPHCREAAQK